MIFVTVGTQIGFDRLISHLDVLACNNPELQFYAQIADGEYIPKNFSYTRFMSSSDFSDYFDSADIVISHAGMGTIINSRLKNKKVIVLPRLASLGEHRNDHQVSTTKRLSSLKGVYTVAAETDLAGAIEACLADKDSLSDSSDDLKVNEVFCKNISDYVYKNFGF